MPTIDVSPGDALDPYLDGDLSGESIQIPAGTYVRNDDWSVTLSGTTVEGVGGQVVIDSGSGHDNGADWDCHNDSTVRDITFAGQFGSKGGGSFNAATVDGGARLTFENCRWPDGAASMENPGHAMYLRPEHDGAIRFRNCVMRDFADNAIYGSAPGAGGGTLEVENCEFYHNNVASVRFGGNGSYVRDSYFEVEGSQAGYTGGGTSPRGVWIHSSGSYTVENCDFVFNTDGGNEAPIQDHPDGSGADVTVENCRMQQNGGGPVMNLDRAGNVSGSGNHATGNSGAYVSHPGVFACLFNGCQSPGDDGGEPGETGDHTLEITTSESVGSTEYAVTTTGRIFPGTAAESSDVIAENGNGSWTVTGTAGSGYGDSFTANGQVVSVDSPDGLTVLWDGSVVGEADDGDGDDGNGDGDGDDGNGGDNGGGQQPDEAGVPLLALGLLGAAAARSIRQRNGE